MNSFLELIFDIAYLIIRYQQSTELSVHESILGRYLFTIHAVVFRMATLAMAPNSKIRLISNSSRSNSTSCSRHSNGRVSFNKSASLTPWMGSIRWWLDQRWPAESHVLARLPSASIDLQAFWTARRAACCAAIASRIEKRPWWVEVTHHLCNKSTVYLEPTILASIRQW